MKKILSITLAVLLVLGVFPIAASALSGAGTADNPYLIKTKADLDDVRNNLSAYYKLYNDITFTAADFASSGAFYNSGAGFLPIKDFTGTFDGNNKTITGLKQVSSQMVTGLFAHIGSGSSIKNLNLKECSINVSVPDSVYVGGIAGSSSGTISNCSFNGTIIAKSTWAYTTTSAGGIVGIAYSTVSGCKNSGSITGSGNIVYVGGVAGEGDTANIVNCSNAGMPSGGYCGGIVGSLTDDGKVSKCSNSAALKGSGIAGEVEDGSMVEQSYNTGNLNGGSGIASVLDGGTIKYCYNTGAITGISVGGIVNVIHGTSVVEFCYNTGNISASNESYAYAAGIAAYIDDNTGDHDCIIRNCFNIGTISNTCAKDYNSFTAGIIGEVPPYWNEVVNCYNRGSIKYAGYYHGGIIGSIRYAPAVQNCYYLDIIDHGSNTLTVGVKVTDAQMKLQSTFKGFDFTNVWTMAGNSAYLYPELKALTMVDTRQYTVTFNSQGGSSVSKAAVKHGGKLTAPKNPTRSGYVFAGWYKESSCKNAWNFSKDTVSKAITLYAKWSYAPPGKPVISSAASASYNSVKISWKKASLATRYQVYRATSAKGTYSKVADTSSLNYTNKNLSAGKTYYYKVKAYYKKGSTTVYGSFSDVKSAKPVPATPTSVKAKKATSTSIKLTWKKVTGASGYEIVRCLSKTGTYTIAATVAGGTKTSYINTKLTLGTMYYYKMRAYRTVSGKKVYSNYSGIVSAKT
jgi:uncharacterized repeat protein (TIGR02543 family)